MNDIQEPDSRTLEGNPERLIGTPWKEGGRSLTDGGLDCFGLLKVVYDECLGIELPEYSDITRDTEGFRDIMSAESNKWVSVIHPQHLDAVLFVKNGIASHVGVFIVSQSRGYVLHAVDGFGVVRTHVRDARFFGFGKLNFFRHGNSLSHPISCSK